MMLRRYLLGLLFVSFSMLQFTSCNLFDDELGLTNGKVIEALKKALNMGTDEASSKLSATDGFYLDAAAKILLPDEAQVILAKKDNEIFQSLGLTSKIDDKLEEVILGVNRSAEDAATEVAPIFSSAITDLSIADGFDILNGIVPGAASTKADEGFDSTAATTYLEQQTLLDLVGIFSPKIDKSLDKDLVGGLSANEAWSGLLSTYNGGVDKYNQLIDFQEQASDLTGGLDLFGASTKLSIGLPFDIPGMNVQDVLNLDLGDRMESLDIDLSDHCTNKALSAVFGKIAIKEKEIRHDPFAFGDKLIEDVFGSVFEE